MTGITKFFIGELFQEIRKKLTFFSKSMFSIFKNLRNLIKFTFKAQLFQSLVSLSKTIFMWDKGFPLKKNNKVLLLSWKYNVPTFVLNKIMIENIQFSILKKYKILNLRQQILVLKLPELIRNLSLIFYKKQKFIKI